MQHVTDAPGDGSVQGTVAAEALDLPQETVNENMQSVANETVETDAQNAGQNDEQKGGASSSAGGASSGQGGAIGAVCDDISSGGCDISGDRDIPGGDGNISDSSGAIVSDGDDMFGCSDVIPIKRVIHPETAVTVLPPALQKVMGLAAQMPQKKVYLKLIYLPRSQTNLSIRPRYSAVLESDTPRMNRCFNGEMKMLMFAFFLTA
ncbi:hypothetical protein PI124_g21820 [Phytophthora idaei]|nr:hypothetical protein PI125_g23826 [Phytophthora idaei]KAG3128993.1 hypothetical protein PI126_g21147 [Phytophthora idaei]KAG3233102.1 hypothetical protein PI124_g21820 [Phytophthora idaei]